MPFAAAAIPALTASLGAGAGTAGSLLAAKAAQKAEDRNILKPNTDEDFVVGLANDKNAYNPQRSFGNANRPVIFGNNKSGIFGRG